MFEVKILAGELYGEPLYITGWSHFPPDEEKDNG